MLGCLCKALLREGLRHICKMEKLKMRAVIKYICTSVRKECLPKEIHEDFMENLGKEPPSYSTVKKKGQQSLRGGKREL